MKKETCNIEMICTKRRNYRSRKCAICSYKRVKQRDNTENVRMRSMFLVPKDQTVRNVWEDIISQSLNELDYICDAHFCAEDIDSYFETKMPDGTINHIQRERIKLKPNAVPRKAEMCEKRMSDCRDKANVVLAPCILNAMNVKNLDHENLPIPVDSVGERDHYSFFSKYANLNPESSSTASDVLGLDLEDSTVLPIKDNSMHESFLLEETPLLQSPLTELRLSPIEYPAPGEFKTPKEPYWIIHVTVVKTSGIWGRLVGEDYSDQLNAVSQQMNEFYAENFESTKVSDVELNGYYSICVGDNWCRVRCLEYNPETEEATVFFIDHGDNEIWHGKLLHNLDKRFCELPGQALRLSLQGLEGFADFEEAAMIVEKYLQYQTLYAEVLTYDVEEDCTSVIFYVPQGPDDVNLNKLMSKEIIEICLPKPHLKEGRITEVYVSHVSKNGDIYVQVKNDSMQYLVDLMNEVIINKLSQDLNKLAVTKVNLTELYMVKDEDGNWYRVSVMNVNYATNEVDAFLIDFGKTITVKINSLLDLKSISEMLVQIPGQALQLHLHNIPPSSFDAEKVARLKELTPPNTPLLVKEVIRTRTDKLSPPIVELLKRQEPSNEIITINNTLLLEEELPSPNNDDDNKSASRTRISNERLTSLCGSSADENDPLQRNAVGPTEIPPIGDYFDIHFTMASNSGNFMVQSHENQMGLIHAHCNSESSSTAFDALGLDLEDSAVLSIEDNSIQESFIVKNPSRNSENSVERESRCRERILKEKPSHFGTHIKGENANIYSFKNLQRDVEKRLRDGWLSFPCNRSKVIIGQWNKLGLSPKKLIIDTDMSAKVYLHEVQAMLPGIRDVRSFEDVFYNLALLRDIKPCPGVDGSARSEACFRYFEGKSRSEVCIQCRLQRRKMISREAYQKKRSEKESTKKKPNLVRPFKEKVKRLKRKVTKFREGMMHMKNKCAQMNEAKIEEKIRELPPEQQEAVRACFNAAKVKSPRGKRYDTRWVYECILMRIKSKSLYRHILDRKILSVPTLQSLDSYLKKMHSSYGFDINVFECLKDKTADMSELERRGVLLLDEMQLNPTVSFDRKNFRFNGFTDLGAYTPVRQSRELGDHALVFMYQPLAGKWVQTLACFLSKGCATGKILSHLLIECINLLHACGLYVDAVVSDGAQWNRGMWTQFGVNQDNVSCDHPCEKDEKLWFLSDFPHLIKNLRNFLVSREDTWTPDGMIQKKHWRALLEVENKHFYNMKVASKLTEDHLNPKYFQKMNVPMAFYFFSEPVYKGMEFYSNFCDDLKDSQGTRTFMERVTKLIGAMMSRSPQNALRENSEEYAAISEFLIYLQDWDEGAKKEWVPFLSPSTFVGLKVTLKATLEIFHFLKEKFDINYLMTSRLNQDALERFFGLVREACGSNDHPDSRIFAQVFRLLSVYSLIKPRKGSNIEGVDILNTMLNFNDLQKEKHQEKLCEILDRVILKDSPAVEEIPNFLQRVKEHDARLGFSPDFVQYYMAGYVAFRAKKLTKCVGCIENVRTERKPSDEERSKMIDSFNRGRLQYPSEDLYQLTNNVENIILHILAGGQLNCDTFSHILDSLDNCVIPKVGCSSHRNEFTKSITSFYLITRSHFIAKRYNTVHDFCKKKSRKCRKDAKL